MNTDFIAFRFTVKPRMAVANMDEQDKKDRTINNAVFRDNQIIVGSFFSCIYLSELRIHVQFEKDTCTFLDDVAKLIDDTLKRSGHCSGKIWVGNRNEKTIRFLVKRYGVIADTEIFHYESVEYHFPKNKLSPLPQSELIAKPYDPASLHLYLELLNNAMRFKIPHHDYLAHAQQYAGEFARYNAERAFEAFWDKDRLIGLYWLEGMEIDHLAVAAEQQRRGYGGIILSHAIHRVFETQQTDHAMLLAVGWNIDAQNFYQKFGMERVKDYRVRYVREPAGDIK